MRLVTWVMMVRFRKFWQDYSGVTTLEAALVMPALLIFIFGILECGLTYHLAAMTNYAADEVARKAKTGNLYNKSSVDEMVRQTAIEALGIWYSSPSDLVISSKTKPAIYGVDGQVIVYTVTYQWKVITPLYSLLNNTTTNYPISATALVKTEY